MFRSILLPLDGSTFAEHAVPLAIEVAHRAGAVLHPVHVYVPDESWRNLEALTPYQFEQESAAEPEYEREERRDEHAYLERIAQLARDRNVTAVPEVLDGAVPEALEHHIRHVGADLVIMATHGRGTLNRAWIGSVADAMVRHVPVPILLVHPTEETAAEPDRAPSLDRVLVPLDGSPLAEQALEPAAALGHLWHAHCTLLAVTPPSSLVPERVDARAAAHPRPPAGGDHDSAQSYLEHVAERIRPEWAGVDVRVVDERHVPSAILWNAGDLKADLIVIATHGRGGLTRVVLGSVADKVVRGATVPVLVFRPSRPPS